MTPPCPPVHERLRSLAMFAMLGFIGGAMSPMAIDARIGDPCTFDTLTVSGIVRTSAGTRVGSGEVAWYGVVPRADCRGSRSEYVRSPLATDGTFTLRIPEGRWSASVNATDQFGATSQTICADILLSRDTLLDVRLRAIRVVGLVSTIRGEPLESGVVHWLLDRPWMDLEGGMPGAPIEHGRFQSIVREPGRYLFRVAAEPGTPSTCTLREPIVIGADTTLLFSLDGPLVRGSVRRPDGTPLPRARVSARSKRADCIAETDSLGGYSMRLVPGTYEWKISPMEDWIMAESCGSDSVSESKVHDLRHTGVVWRGRAIHAGTGHALDSIFVQVCRLGADGPEWPCASSRTDGDGWFRVVVPSGATYSLTLKDTRPSGARIEPKGLEAWEWHRELRRGLGVVERTTLEAIASGSDSTFVVEMEPIPGR